MVVVHVTHEAVAQVGGIGAVIAGLVTSEAYAGRVSRTILLGPLFVGDSPAGRRLGTGGKVIYSSLDSLAPSRWAEKFAPIEAQHEVHIVYGTRPVTDACTRRTVETEVVLVDVSRADHDRLDRFKAALYEKFAVPSDRFQDVWDFEQYVRLAEPGFRAVRALAGDGRERMIVIAHEYMGVPTALAAVMSGENDTRTVFYAHEVASVRPVVETSPGHDTMFYNVLAQAQCDGATIEEVFPSVADNYKHPLVKAARHCDHVFAVGEQVRRELAFVDSRFRPDDIDLVFNGIPAERVTPAQRSESRSHMQHYAADLFGWRPTWVMSHVARPVLSKGIWRDLRVLHALEGMLAARGESAAYFMLGTLGGQRRRRDVRRMERTYGWPVHHARGYPDLVPGEDLLAEMFEHFNSEHRAVRVVLVNQWGWDRRQCGRRMPREMNFADIRRGVDVEFGLSIYEPFGISQLEPLGYGAVCVASSVCGCVGFARRAAGDEGMAPNVLVGDFVTLAAPMETDRLKELTIADRTRLEDAQAQRLAGLLAEALVDADDVLSARLERGQQLARRMSWEHVVGEYFLPALDRAAHD